MATASTVKPLLDNAWLQIDSQVNQGSGRTPQVNTGGDIPNPQVPTPDHSIAPDYPVVAPVSDEILHANDQWAFGASYPSFTQGEWKRSPVQTPQGNVHGEPDENAYNLGTGPGTVRVTQNAYAGYDKHSQSTDNKGWRQNTPSGRTATRKLLGANGVGYEDFWFKTASRPVPKRLALTAVPNNSPVGTPGVLNGTSLPNYADVAYGGQGDIAYSTPAPPMTTQPTGTGQSASNWQGW